MGVGSSVYRVNSPLPTPHFHLPTSNPTTMKKILPILFCLISWGLSAQDFSVKGKIINDNGPAVEGAYVSLLYPWNEEVKSAVTDASGQFEFKKVEKGGYKVKSTFLGLQDFVKEITVNASLQLDPIQMKEGSLNLNEIEVKEKLPLAQQLGDTTQYNADAFKTLPDATAEQLLEKMPGVVVDGGKVQAQGEDVKQVLVDGKPFFGNDPTAALRNLPAEVIDKIQVFDQQSEQAQFSGFQDGETTKTINIITRPEMRNGQFGKVYAGYGYEDKYDSGGNVSLFDGVRRISIIGQSNNINIQNFSTDDLLGVTGGGGRKGRGGRGGRGGGRGGSRGGFGGGASSFLVSAQNGIAATNALGFNYSDQFGKNVELTGSYFFNLTDIDEEEDIERNYIDNLESNEIYTEENFSNTKNINHRINMRLEWKIDSMSTIYLRPRLSFQQNDGFSTTYGETNTVDQLLNRTDNAYESQLTGIDFSNSLTYRRRFNKRGRTASISIRNSYNDKKGDSELISDDYFLRNNIPITDTIDQQTDLLTKGWSVSTRLSYTEPLGERSQLSLDYRNSVRKDDSDKETYDYMEATDGYTSLNEQLSSVFENTYTTNQMGGGYRFNKGRDLNIMLRAFFQIADLDSDLTFPLEDQISRRYYSVLPMAMFRYRFSKMANIRFFYRSSTQSPSVEQLQNVVDNSNPLQLSIGNPELDQAVQHRLSFRYSKTNTDKANIFYFMVNTSFTDDYVGTATYLSRSDNPIFNDLQLSPGVQLTQPVNLDGYWNVRSFLTYGVPITAIKTNFNLDLSTNYVRTPGLLDDALNYSNNLTYGAGATFASNISEKVDFMISTRSSISDVNNTLETATDSRYWNQNTKLRLGWIFPGGIIFRSEIAHQYYSGLSEDFNDDYFLWTVGIGKKLFKNQRGEITLSVFDILNQNRRISRDVTDVYIENVQTNVLQRYAMLKFTYNFLNFNTGKKMPTREDEWEKIKRERGWK